MLMSPFTVHRPEEGVGPCEPYDAHDQSHPPLSSGTRTGLYGYCKYQPSTQTSSMSQRDAKLARRRHGPGWVSHDSRQSPAGPSGTHHRDEEMGGGSCSSVVVHRCCCSAVPFPSRATRSLSTPTLKHPNSTKNRSLVGQSQETSTPATRMTWWW